MILWACLQTLASLCCVFLRKQKLIDGTSTTSGALKSSHENNDRKSTDEMKESKMTTHKVSKLTNENTRLTEHKPKSTNQDKESSLGNVSLHGHVYGSEIMKIPYFWLLIATFIIGSALTEMFIFNLADGCFTQLLQFILGLLYYLNVTGKTSHTCYGLHCYYASSGILFALSIATLSSCVTLYIRRQR